MTNWSGKNFTKSGKAEDVIRAVILGTPRYFFSDYIAVAERPPVQKSDGLYESAKPVL